MSGALREVALFVGGMVGIAAAIFAGGWLLIRGGGLVLRAWFELTSSLLPRPAALALAVMLAALSVYAAFYWLAERRKRARLKA